MWPDRVSMAVSDGGGGQVWAPPPLLRNPSCPPAGPAGGGRRQRGGGSPWGGLGWTDTMLTRGLEMAPAITTGCLRLNLPGMVTQVLFFLVKTRSPKEAAA
ncbi:hypothetical protein GCM10009099_35690 [Caenispirillum bisanense]